MSHRKRWLFRLVTACLVIGVCEFSAYVALRVWFSRYFEGIPIRRFQEDIARHGESFGAAVEPLHPYLGWVLMPDSLGVTLPDGKQIPVNRFGFVDDGNTLYKRSPDQLLIGICGGSVAQQFATIGADTFTRSLEEHPAWRGKKVRLVNLAMSGFKQPQQLMAVNYLLAQGGELDCLINVDGYNEVALAVVDNAMEHVSLAYPRSWDSRLQNVIDQRDSVSFRLLTSKLRRQDWARWGLTTRLRGTWTAKLIWAVADHSLQSEQQSLFLELRQRRDQSGHGFERDGPREEFADDDAMLAAACRLWSESSLLLHQICASRGIRYLHVLQPNQYHKNSKPLSPEEREQFVVPHQDYGQAIEAGYPRLIAAGRELRERGVGFHDLTMLFAGMTETIYSDYFCHYNQRGTNLLAEQVAKLLLDQMESPPTEPSPTEANKVKRSINADRP